MTEPVSPVRRVLMTADTIGGVWQYALALTRGLGHQGIEVTLATMGGEPSRTQCREAASIPSLTLKTSRFRLEWMPEPWRDVEASGHWLLDLDAAVKPDVVHLNGYCHGSLPWRAPALIVAHSCALSWWDAVRGTPIPIEWHRYRAEVQRGLHAAGAVYAPSRAMATAIDHWYGRCPGVIPNGCNSRGGFEPSVAKRRMVFGAGRLWDEAKNLAALDRAGTGLACPIFLAGEITGPSGQQFEPRSAIVLGNLSRGQLADWMRDAAIYALPARYEPFGLSVLEAALCACVLVLGDIPSLRENWDGAAVFVDPDDDGALGDAIQSLLASPARRHELGRRAHARACAFTADRMVAGYLAAYQRILQPEHAGRVAASA